MRTCKNCGVDLPESSFYPKGPGKTLDTWCKGCRSRRGREEYAAARSPEQLQRLAERDARRQTAEARGLTGPKAWSSYQRDRRRAFLIALKDGPCADCGHRFPAVVMDFDHLRDKRFVISSGVFTNSTEVLLAEVAKCDLVCANCHRVRTAKRRDGPLIQVELDYCI